MIDIEQLLAWRGIEPDEACKQCGGSGVVTYSSTATWRGGIGGQALTNDACDKCWGSGNEYRPWPSHRGQPDRIKELEVALSFYAKENNWRSVTVYMCGHGAIMCNVMADKGNKARAALGESNGQS